MQKRETSGTEKAHRPAAGEKRTAGIAAADKRPEAEAQSRLAQVANGDAAQRVERLGAHGWVADPAIDIATLDRAGINAIRPNIFSLLNPAGTYRLSAAELRAFNARDTALYNSPAEAAARAAAALAADQARLARITACVNAGDPWAITGNISRMGDGAHGYNQNWELSVSFTPPAAAAGAGAAPARAPETGVIHLHFNTNSKASVSAATLGTSHIKTTQASAAGHTAAPAAMTTQAIADILASPVV